MSKTNGNVIDPLMLMDEFGTDALRFTMLVGSTPGNDTNVGPKKVEAQPQLCQQDLECGQVCDQCDRFALRRWTEDGRRSTESDRLDPG